MQHGNRSVEGQIGGGKADGTQIEDSSNAASSQTSKSDHTFGWTKPGPGNNSYRGRGGGGRGNYRGGNHGGGIRDGPATGYIRMRGLPFQGTKQDVLDFFKDHKPIESSILLTYHVDGRATGEGYVAFDNVSDAQSAMALHRSSMGNRYIELFISNKDEHARNVSRSVPPS